MFAAQPLGGDYGASQLTLLVIGLLVVGARLLAGQPRYVANDPLFRATVRAVADSQRPHGRQLLKQFTQSSLHADAA